MTTINKEEIQKFSNLADEWWDEKGKFKPLHMFNPIRLEYIVEKTKQHFALDDKKQNFLQNFRILDIGCGGGLISEPMARLGASVKGIDASEKNINVAKIHAKRSNLKIDYKKNSPEELNVKDLKGKTDKELEKHQESLRWAEDALAIQKKRLTDANYLDLYWDELSQ